MWTTVIDIFLILHSAIFTTFLYLTFSPNILLIEQNIFKKEKGYHSIKKKAKIIPFIPCFFLPSTDRIDGPVFCFCTLNSLTAYRRVNKTSLKTLFRLYVSSNFSVLLALILSSIFFRNLRENQYEIMRTEVLTMQTSSLVMPITRSVYHNLKCDFFPTVPDDCTTVKTPGQSSVMGIHHSSPCLADG